MDLNKKEYQLLQRVVKTRQKVVAATPIWKRLHSAFELGVLSGSKLHFNLADLEKMREITGYKLSMDPLYVSAEGDRIALACVTHNEKLSRAPIFAMSINVARPNNLPIFTPDGFTSTPKNTALTIMNGELDMSRFNKIVLIENGSLFANWASLKLPEECADALLIYRGHGAGIKTTYNLLRARPATCVLYGFFDFDPAGLAMSLEVGCDRTILPANIAAIFEGDNFRRLNKEERFHRQWARKGQFLKDRCCKQLIPIVEVIENLKVALTQEALISLDIKLGVY